LVQLSYDLKWVLL